MPKQKPKRNTDKSYCRKCTQWKAIDNFHETTNPLLDTNGRLSVCKECANDVFLHYYRIYGDMRKAIVYTCRDLDIRFSEDALSQAQVHIEKMKARGHKPRNIFGYYKSKLGSFGRANKGYDSFRFIDSDPNEAEVVIKFDTDEDIEEELVKYWGEGKEPWEYRFLDNEMFKMKTDFECPDYSMEMIMKDICFLNLEIEKVRKGKSGDIVKLINTRSTLMNDGNLKPVQSTGADRNERVSFGVFIKKWENEKPIEKRLDNEMKQYIDTFFIGHLAKMEGLDNEIVRQYEEALNEYTIDFDKDINYIEEDDQNINYEEVDEQ